MKIAGFRLLTFAIILQFIFTGNANSQKPHNGDTISRAAVENLKVEIRGILADTNTPAVGIAMVSRSGLIWIGGLGKSNVQQNIPANQNTIFRTASVSKMLVALSILKLEAEGKLKLDDKIRDIAPEVKFKNPWEKSDPVRIIHLLNHTTGWDEIHPPELAHNDSVPISLKDALDFHPHSRISRWVPGTRHAYSNSGYGVAGYIIEKISGMEYEQFVQAHFLDPLRMKRTTFFNDKVFKLHGALHYNAHLDVLPYRHVLYRPAGAMNSSPSDMAHLIQLLLNRGAFDNQNLIHEQAIIKMEIPQTTPGAKAGLELGYGLGNKTSIHNGFVYQGHEGSLDGGLCELAYLPDHGIGHVIFMNATKPEAFFRISKLVRDFETSLVQKTNLSTTDIFHKTFRFNDGYYVPINPRNQKMFFMDYLIGSERIQLEGTGVNRSWIFTPGQTEQFIPVSDTTFLLANTGKIGLVKAKDPLAGEVLYFDKLVMKKIPAFTVLGQILLLSLWIVFTVYGFVFWIINGIRTGLKTKRTSNLFRLYSFTTITSVLYATVVVLLKMGFNDYDEAIAKPGLISVLILFTSLLILGSCIVSIIAMYRNRNLTTLHRYPVQILSIIQFLVTAYLVTFGVIPVITWA